MKLFLIIGVFEALFLMILILSKKRKNLPDYILSASFLLFGLTILLAALEIYNRENSYPFPWLINTSTAPILLHGPFLWFYIKSLTTLKFRFRPIYLLHFVPFIFTIFAINFSMWSLPVEQRIISDSQALFKHHLFYPIVIGLIAISNQAYFIWGLLILRRHNRNVKNYFSQIENLDLKWLKILLIGGLISYSSISLIYIADFAFGWLPYNFMQLMGFAIASLFVLIQGFFGQKQGIIFREDVVKAMDIKLNDEIKQTEPLKSEDEAFINILLDYMKKDKPYLNPDLSIAVLASELNVSSDYLSGILNGKLNRNFFDFVNKYRIEEFKTACKDPKNAKYTLISIAYDCGFNSKATFNRVFKAETGLTPGEYQKLQS